MSCRVASVSGRIDNVYRGEVRVSQTRLSYSSRKVQVRSASLLALLSRQAKVPAALPTSLSGLVAVEGGHHVRMRPGMNRSNVV